MTFDSPFYGHIKRIPLGLKGRPSGSGAPCGAHETRKVLRPYIELETALGADNATSYDVEH